MSTRECLRRQPDRPLVGLARLKRRGPPTVGSVWQSEHMSQASVTLILAGGAAAGGYGLTRVLRAQRSDWDVSAHFVFLMGWLFFLPSAFAGFTGTKVQSTDVNKDPVRILLPPAILVTHLCNYLLLVVPVAFILYQASRGNRPRGPAILAELLWAASTIVAGINNYPMFTKASITLGVALLAIALLPSGRGACLGAATFVVTLAIASGTLALVDFHLATSPCEGLYKCGPLGVFVFGVVDNENGLAIALASGIAFIWLGVRSTRSRLLLCGYILGVVVISGARTSTYATVALLAILSVFGRGTTRAKESNGSSRVSTTVELCGLALALALAASAGAILPFFTASPSAFTYRGALWLTARQDLAGHYFLGLGSAAWQSLVANGALGQNAAYSVHNQFLDVIWVSGVLGLSIFLLMLIYIIRLDVSTGLVLLLALMLLGITERPWSISHFDEFSFTYLATLVACAGNLQRKSSSRRVAPYGPAVAKLPNLVSDFSSHRRP